MLPDDGLGNGQAQAEASLGAAAVGPVEPLEQVGQHLRRDGRAAVFHRQHGLSVRLDQGHADLCPLGGVFDGVVQQDPATCCS